MLEGFVEGTAKVRAWSSLDGIQLWGLSTVAESKVKELICSGFLKPRFVCWLLQLSDGDPEWPEEHDDRKSCAPAEFCTSSSRCSQESQPSETCRLYELDWVMQ